MKTANDMTLGLRREMKSSKELREDIHDKLVQAQALGELCASEERELTDEEGVQLNAILDEVGNDGLDGEARSGMWAKVDQAEKLERIANDLKSRPAQNAGVVERPKQPAIVNKYVGKLKAFKTPQEAYDCGLWFKGYVLGDENARQAAQDKGIYAAQTEGTNSAGGFLTPDALAAAVINVRESAGICSELVRRVPMPSDSFDLPKRSAGQTVYYPGEASAITASDKTYAQVSLTATKRAVMTQVSNELIADALINVMEDIAQEAGHALAFQMDNELINGDGSSSYGSVTGLISGVAAGNTVTMSSGNTAFTDITLADLHSAVSKVGEKFQAESNLSWIMLRSTFAEVVQKLVYAAGGNTVDTITGGMRPQLFGYPIYFTDHMPASAVIKFCALVCNFNAGVVMGDRQGVEVATSADYGFNLDVMTIRLTSRYDLNVHESDAYAGVKTAAS